jgi:uncharacterized BrkB/YihY/UPF0761 family membrane protein
MMTMFFFLSSGITFNLLICLLPLMLLLLSLADIYLYSNREVLNHIRNYLQNAIPTFDPRSGPVKIFVSAKEME